MFDVAYDDLTNILRFPDATATIKYSRNVFIDGASGCGKTRFGWELYQRVKREAQKLGLSDVGYAVLQAGQDYDMALQGATDNEKAHDTTTANRALAVMLVRQYAEQPNLVLSPSVTFSDIVKHLARAHRGAKDGKAAFVLHFDEFQQSPIHVAAMLRVVRDHNTTFALSTPVLPVLSGLVASASTLALVSDGITGVSSVVHTLHYFEPTDERTWQLVCNAERALRSISRLQQYKTRADAPRSLRYLVEDTLGWQQAAVQLGVAIALARSDALDWRAVEDDYLDLVKKYNSSEVLAPLVNGSNSAARKLLLLALSPHAVCG